MIKYNFLCFYPSKQSSIRRDLALGGERDVGIQFGSDTRQVSQWFWSYCRNENVIRCYLFDDTRRFLLFIPFLS